MICEKCAEQGLKSRVTSSGDGSMTLASSYNFYDENGDYHSHNPNTVTSEY